MTLARRALIPVLSVLLAAPPALAGPIVVPTAEGQIGSTPDPDDRIFGPYSFEAFHSRARKLAMAGISQPGGAMPPPPEAQFFTDLIHGGPAPVQIGAEASVFANVDKVAPDSSGSPNAAGNGDFVAFSFAVDGSMPQTMTVRIATFDEDGTSMVEAPVISDLTTFMFPDPIFAKTGVGIDDQGRATVAYTDFVGGIPQVRATRLDGVGGTGIDTDFLITAEPHANPDVALLDPAGNRLVVATNELVNPPTIQGHIVDFSGGTPVVGPEFLINDTSAAFGDINPTVVSDPATGDFTVVWDHNTGVVGDPADVRARRFDAMGNPVGGDFRVNTTTANAQGQPAAAYGPDGLSAIVWAADPIVPMVPNDLDVFLQVYGPDGEPLDGQIQVNTFTDDVQDRPTVRFLPDRDAQGRPQVTVVWRDAGAPDGSQPRGTGVSYRCFSVNGFEEQVPIFEDGFESGDTSSWSSKQP